MTNPFLTYPVKANPITKEEVQRFIERESRSMILPREPMIIVHPSDLEAAKKFFRSK